MFFLVLFVFFWWWPAFAFKISLCGLANNAAIYSSPTQQEEEEERRRSLQPPVCTFLCFVTHCSWKEQFIYTEHNLFCFKNAQYTSFSFWSLNINSNLRQECINVSASFLLTDWVFTTQTTADVFNSIVLHFLQLLQSFIFTTNHTQAKYNIINFPSSSPLCSKGTTAKDTLNCLKAQYLSVSLGFPQKSAAWFLRRQVKPCDSQCLLWHRNTLIHGIYLASSA